VRNTINQTRKKKLYRYIKSIEFGNGEVMAIKLPSTFCCFIKILLTRSIKWRKQSVDQYKGMDQTTQAMGNVDTYGGKS
jgi:hypothetical protein